MRSYKDSSSLVHDITNESLQLCHTPGKDRDEESERPELTHMMPM